LGNRFNGFVGLEVNRTTLSFYQGLDMNRKYR